MTRAVTPAFCPLVAVPGSSARGAPGETVISRRPRCVLAPSPAPPPASLHSPLFSARTALRRELRSRFESEAMSSGAGPASDDDVQPWTAARSSSSTPPPAPTPMPAPPGAPSPSPPPPPPNGRSPDYHANVGSVIDTLRADYPALLTEAPCLDIFRDDMVFTDTSGNRLHGKDAYRTVLFLLRLHVRVMLSSAALSIVSLHYRDDEPAVHVRWRLRAAPRQWASAAAGADPCGTTVDGLCVYYLDARGAVAHHAMETIVRADRPMMVRSLFERVLAVGQIGVADGARVPAGNIYGAEHGRNAVLRSMLDGAQWTALPEKDAAEARDDEQANDDATTQLPKDGLACAPGA